MKNLLAALLLFSFAGFAVTGCFAADTTINGYVSDSFCGARGAMESHGGCMAKCVEKGAKTVIVIDGDQKILTVDNPETLKGHAGHHVSITGAVNGDSIHISSVKML